ncbi:MAG: hypothetical protein U0487_01930 [Patescibacteria group bacterium]
MTKIDANAIITNYWTTNRWDDRVPAAMKELGIELGTLDRCRKAAKRVEGSLGRGIITIPTGGQRPRRPHFN